MQMNRMATYPSTIDRTNASLLSYVWKAHALINYIPWSAPNSPLARKSKTRFSILYLCACSITRKMKPEPDASTCLHLIGATTMEETVGHAGHMGISYLKPCRRPKEIPITKNTE